MVGELPNQLDENQFLQNLKENFKTPVIKHTALYWGKPVQKIAVCGGAGAFLPGLQYGAGADIYHYFRHQIP
jgi:hypothetical protein